MYEEHAPLEETLVLIRDDNDRREHVFPGIPLMSC